MSRRAALDLVTAVPADIAGRAALMALPGSTLADSLRYQLEAAIAAGQYAPGARLDEQEIAARYGVSRTPVREAFRLLAASHLVELRGRQGATVRTLRAPALIEMFQVMAELEGLCARLAARRLTPLQRRRVEAIHERLVAVAATRDVELFYGVNLEFHDAIYEASHSAFLAEQTRRLRTQLDVYRRRVTRAPNRIEETVREHEAVLAAILDHDGEAAHRLMRDHVNLLGDALLDLIAAFP